jgi:lysophospholipase L1-like esterase
MRPSLRIAFVASSLSALAPLGSGARAQPPTPVPAPAAAPEGLSFPGQWAPAPTSWKYPVWSRGCARFTAADERVACLEFITADWPRLSRYAEANAALGAPRAGDRRVVFFGDSITDNWSKPGYGGFFPGKPYVNRGIGGQTTAQMLVRFRPDVLALAPRAVVILAGTNDISGNNGPVRLEAVQDNLDSMAQLAKANGVRVVLASLLPVSDDKTDKDGKPVIRSQERPLATLTALNTWLAAYAKKNGHVYLDYFAALADERGAFKPAFTDDGLHPNAAGYAVMAPLAEKALQRAGAAASRR